MQQRQEQHYENENGYVHLFPQDGMRFQNSNDMDAARKQRKYRRDRKHKKPRFFFWRNVFALIGVIAVIVQAMRYLIIPLLVYLNSLMGGVL